MSTAWDTRWSESTVNKNNDAPNASSSYTIWVREKGHDKIQERENKTAR